VSPFECKVLGAVVERQIFSAVQEHCPLEKASRQSPFAAVLGSTGAAIPFCPPTEVGVYETKPAKAG